MVQTFVLRRFALLLGALWAIGALLPAAAARGAVVQCGDVITHSVTLSADVENCPGDGLHVGADGIRINLNGHTISSGQSLVSSGEGIANLTGNATLAAYRAVRNGSFGIVAVAGDIDGGGNSQCLNLSCSP